MRAFVPLFATTMLVAGCDGCGARRAAREPVDGGHEPIASAAPDADAPSTETGVDASTSASAEETTPEDAGPARCARYGPAMARGRTATNAKRWDDAESAFTEAIRAHPVDPRPRAERGFARIQAGRAKDALADLSTARSLTKDAALLRSIWWNLGLAAEATKDDEVARVAFASALALGHGGAKAKLGARSTCPATWRAMHGAADAPEAPIAKSWAELGQARQVTNCEVFPPAAGATKEQIERNAACHGCGYGQKDEGFACDAEGNGAVPSGYMHFHTFTFFVEKIGKNRWWYSNGTDGDGRIDVKVESGYVVDAHGASGPGELPALSGGGFVDLRSTSDREPYVRAGDVWSDETNFDSTPLEDGGTVCHPMMKAEVELDSINAAQMGGTPAIPRAPRDAKSLYSIATGKLAFAFASYAGDVALEIEPGAVVVRGSGCDATIAIDR